MNEKICNPYGVSISNLSFGTFVQVLSWPTPLLQLRLGRILSYNPDSDLLVIIDSDNHIHTSRFALVLDAS